MIEPHEATMNRLNLLQIEDNVNDALLIQRNLLKFGYQVAARRIETAQELEVALNEQSWDVVLSDYAMPDFDGIKALAMIRESSDLPFILVSGAVGEETAVEIMKAGACDFVFKDKLDRLGPAVRRALRESQVLREKEKNERILQAIIKSMARATGQQAFLNILNEVGNWLGVEHALVGRLRPDSTVETLAFFVDNQLSADISYSLADTPCAQAIQQGVTLIPERLGDFFATSHYLAPLEAESYLGLPLKNKDQEVIGILAFMSRRPFTPPDRFNLILELAADRAASEVERLQCEAEQFRLEEQLRHSQKIEAIGTMSGGIAHDFNNILSGIIGYSEMARRDMGELPDTMRKIDKVLQASHRAKELVQQILTFSRHSDEEKKAVDLCGICREAMKLLRASIPSSVEFHLTIATSCKVMAVPSQMHQIIMNLCTNAYQAMAINGGLLTIGLDQAEVDEEGADRLSVKPGSYARLTVSDNGHGIAPEIKERIFEPYFTTKEGGGGTGLGLALIHGIVQGHHGAIDLDSDIGRGATFTIWLPQIREERMQEELSEENTAWATGSERILLADDEELVLHYSQEMLAMAGYRVTAARNGVEALQIFQEDPNAFDLVLTDMTMPKMSGMELTRQCLSLRPELPVILCTGYSDQVSRESAANAGVRAYLTKPVGGSKLCDTIRQVLDTKAALNQPLAY